MSPDPPLSAADASLPVRQAAELVTSHLSEYESHMRRTTLYLEERLEVRERVIPWFFFIQLIPVFPSQLVFKDKIRFNSRFPGSDRLPNTCNVSILGPALQGDVAVTPSSDPFVTLLGSERLVSPVTGWRLLSSCTRLLASVGAACHSDSSHR